MLSQHHPAASNANLAQKKPCPAPQTSVDTTHPCKEHTSLSCLPYSPSEASAAAQPAGLASLAERQARDQPTATVLSDSPGVIKSSCFTTEIPQTKPVSGRADCTEATGREEREMEWPCLDRGWSLSSHSDKHLGIYQGFPIMLSTTMCLAIVS